MTRSGINNSNYVYLRKINTKVNSHTIKSSSSTTRDGFGTKKVNDQHVHTPQKVNFAVCSSIIRPSDVLKQVRHNYCNNGGTRATSNGINNDICDPIFSTDSKFLGIMLESLLGKWSNGNRMDSTKFFKYVVSNLYSQKLDGRYGTVIKFLAGVRARLCFFGEMQNPKRDLKCDSHFMRVNQIKLSQNEIYYEMIILLSRQYKKALFNSHSMNRMSIQDKMYLWDGINDSIKLKAKHCEFSTSISPAEQLSSIILQQCSIVRNTFNLLDLASKIVDNSNSVSSKSPMCKISSAHSSP